MLDRAIIDHASPTLARLKLGNLFNHGMGTGFPAEFAALGRELADKGVTMMILKAVNGKALIYIYRSADLEKVLMCEDVRQLLRACGYSRFDVSGALDTLKARLNDIDAFPPRDRRVPRLSAGGCCGLHRKRRQELPVLRLLEGLRQRMRGA